MDARNPNENELRLLEFLNQILGISDDTQIAGRIMLLGPNGQFVGDATLSARDFDLATEAIRALLDAREAAGDVMAAELDDDPANVSAGIAALERLANGGE